MVVGRGFALGFSECETGPVLAILGTFETCLRPWVLISESRGIDCDFLFVRTFVFALPTLVPLFRGVVASCRPRPSFCSSSEPVGVNLRLLYVRSTGLAWDGPSSEDSISNVEAAVDV
jgi:hypothetical protein